MFELKDIIRGTLRKTGFEIVRASDPPVGRSVYRDTRVIFGPDHRLVVLDVGANIGDMTHELLQSCNIERIYSFEPAPLAFSRLSQRFENEKRVSVFNCGMGSAPSTLELNDFGGQGCMNSFLKGGAAHRTPSIATHNVKIDTVDDFCARMSVNEISLLKIDTQGFDFQVLQGARHMLSSGKVAAVLVEIVFADYYQGQASAGQILDWLSTNGFDPLCFYPMQIVDGRGAWLDGMFVHRSHPIAWSRNSKGHGDRPPGE